MHKRGEEEAAFAVDLAWLVYRLAGAALFGASVASAAVFATQGSTPTPTPTFHPSFTINAQTVAFVERHEGVRYRPYPDPGGKHICTVGAGHVLSWTGGCTAKQLHTVYTAAQVAAFLRADLETAQSCIHGAIIRHITEPAYDGLVDLVFNAGCGSLDYRDVRELVNGGDIGRLPAAWESTATTASGVYLAGLAQRRIDEVDLYVRGYYGSGIGYFVKPKPLTKVQKAEKALRAKTGYYAWLAWYLHEGAWKSYVVHATVVRPHVPKNVPSSWWRRERAFVAGR
jgi:GH24 family phage-related lysozyme (muramidase)